MEITCIETFEVEREITWDVDLEELHDWLNGEPITEDALKNFLLIRDPDNVFDNERGQGSEFYQTDLDKFIDSYLEMYDGEEEEEFEEE